MSDLRIGDAERERALAQLGRHVGDGRLGLAEFTERSDRVAVARTRAELQAVQADLPPLPDPERDARIRRGVLAATWGPWALSTAVCLLIWLLGTLGGGDGYFWPIWVFGPWGLVLLAGTFAGGRQPWPCASGRRSG